MHDDEPKQIFKGCYVATLTPYYRSGEIDFQLIRDHARWLIDNGVEGLCPAGTTGEFLFLSDEEKRHVISATVEGAGGRVPVIAGIWAARPDHASDLARHAEQTGAQGVFLPPPIYYPADDEVIFHWYEQIHRATSLPVFAYNIPQYAGNMVTTACLERLFREGVIAGVKDSMGKTDRMTELVTHFGTYGIVFAASDGFASEARVLGADGFISAIANAAPRLFSRLWAGNASLQPQVDALRTTLKQMGSISALKYLLQRQGFAFGHSRLPFSSLTDAQRTQLDALELPVLTP